MDGANLLLRLPCSSQGLSFPCCRSYRLKLAFLGGDRVWAGEEAEREETPTGPYLLQLLQLALRLCPLQLQVGQLAPHSLHLLAQVAALLPSLRQRLLGGLQAFLGDRD